VVLTFSGALHPISLLAQRVGATEQEQAATIPNTDDLEVLFRQFATAGTGTNLSLKLRLSLRQESNNRGRQAGRTHSFTAPTLRQIRFPSLAGGSFN
jgi:hypothetical protein